MCLLPTCILGAAGLLSVGSAVAAEFQNLNFEQPGRRPKPVYVEGLGADPAWAFPGWQVGSDRYTAYNTRTLGAVAQILIGPGDVFAPLEGRYSAFLQFGPHPVLGTPALMQTGLIPADAKSITFLMSPFFDDARVTLDGTPIPLLSIGGGRVAGDVSSFAGKETELKFSTTSYFGHSLYFDDIRFSSLSVPEPSIGSLAGLGSILVLLYRARRSKVGHADSPL